MLPAQVRDQIVTRTDGVPLFVEELTKTVLESGWLRDVGDHFELTGPLPPLAIPSTLHASLLARLDRLAAVKDVAQIGAVIGREFSYALIAAASALPEKNLKDALSQLVAAEQIYQRGVPPDATYQFKHALVQDASYASLVRSRRQQLHGQIAQALEERALVSVQNAVALARQLAHPFMLVHALDFAAWLYLYRREVQQTREHAQADVELATEHNAAFFLPHGTVFLGWVLIEEGQTTDGIAQMRQGLAAYRVTGAQCERPYLLALLAEAYAKVGQPGEGLLVLSQALSEINEGRRYGEAELYRLKGELLLGLSADNHAEAETCFQEALEIARHQQAKSLELRAAMCLGRLWQRQGKRAAAHQLLGAIYGWFSVGFETADLREAKALLKALA